ncbi:hypothetical protein F3J19_29890 [Burkholderia sp. Ax-1724]|nr:hypothetical protein [Burkholderia sp. Ax-1724]NIF80807.1 hypothetical protein [Paraburkholderia sp. Cy-641]
MRVLARVVLVRRVRLRRLRLLCRPRPRRLGSLRLRRPLLHRLVLRESLHQPRRFSPPLRRPPNPRRPSRRPLP